MSSNATLDRTGIMPPDVFDDGGHHQCDWGVQWCDQPAYGWIDAWPPARAAKSTPAACTCANATTRSNSRRTSTPFSTPSNTPPHGMMSNADS